MKKLLIASALLLASTSASALNWNQISNMGNKVIEPNIVYNIATSGSNVRVYEWTPNDNKDWRCVFGAGETKGGVACYPAKVTPAVYPGR